MRRKTFAVRAITTVAAALLLWSTASFAVTPTLGPDCGAGASIMGSDLAGKVELGTAPSNRSTCTLTFALSGVKACMAVNETNGGGYSTPIGTITTTTTVVIGGALPWVAGDVISYICVSY